MLNSLSSRLALVLALSFCVAAPLRAQEVWVGGGTTVNWSEGANWQSGVAPVNGNDVHFQGSNKTTNFNDLNLALQSLSFDANAAAFTLTGDTLGTRSGGITNNSSQVQTLSFTIPPPPGANLYQGLVVLANQTYTAASGDFNITADVEAAQPFMMTTTMLTFAGSHDTSISGQVEDDPLDVTDSLALVKNGTGTLTLSNDNT
jgi:hypothetical protein